MHRTTPHGDTRRRRRRWPRTALRGTAWQESGALPDVLTRKTLRRCGQHRCLRWLVRKIVFCGVSWDRWTSSFPWCTLPTFLCRRLWETVNIPDVLEQLVVPEISEFHVVERVARVPVPDPVALLVNVPKTGFQDEIQQQTIETLVVTLEAQNVMGTREKE